MRTDYEGLAGRYDEDRARWSFPRDDVVGELIASQPSVRVLDLGCGTGRWLVAQREAFGDVGVAWLGADPSSAMLAEASAKGMTNLVRARAEDLPLRDATIDYVVTSYAFHHFADKDRALDEITRVLTAGGVLGINNIEPAAADGWWLYEFFPEAIEIDARTAAREHAPSFGHVRGARSTVDRYARLVLERRRSGGRRRSRLPICTALLRVSDHRGRHEVDDVPERRRRYGVGG